MTARFGPNEGTDWPDYPTAGSAPQPRESGWDPDTDTAWTQEILGTAWDDEGGA